MKHLEKDLENLRILPNNYEDKKNSEFEMYSILSIEPEDEVFNNFTTIHEHKDLLLSIYHDPAIADEEGFRVTSLACWKLFEKMMANDKQVQSSMSIKF